jgi:aldose 1-epimerase
MPPDPRFSLTAGDYAATVSAVGGALVSLRFGERDLVLSLDNNGAYPLPKYRGAVLAPWPNRIADGRYRFGDADHQVPINEVERGCALHGLLAWTTWQVKRADPDRVVLTDTVWPRPGYPFTVDVRADYVLTRTGLAIELTATNVGGSAAPLGLSLHPYLVAPGDRVDEWTFELGASTVLDVDPERLLPRERRPVEGTPFDFRNGRRIGATQIDHAYTDVAFEEDVSMASLVDGQGTGARMTWDGRSPWVQVHTTDAPGSPVHRSALALEPMTCPPGAFSSGTDLISLEPGASAGWGCTLAAVAGA